MSQDRTWVPVCVDANIGHNGAMKLYHYDKSSCSWRARIALAVKGIDYESVAIDVRMDKREQDDDGYRAVNAQGQVPTLEWAEGDGSIRRIAQSLAIVEYLEATHPEPPLLPADPYLAARARQLAEIVNAGIQPLQNNRVLKDVAEQGGDRRAWAVRYVESGLRAYAAIAAPTLGQYSVGDSVSIADVCLIPQLRNAWNFGIEPSTFPALVAIEKRCLESSAFAETRPK